MAKRRSNKRKSSISAAALIAAIILVIAGRFFVDSDTSPKFPVGNADGATAVHVIDVGQGSSTLIQSGETGILIDGGERVYGQTVVEYLCSVGIKELSYVVASHPHTDHIGGLTAVLNYFPVENVIMPYLTEENTPTTKTYESFLELIDEKNIRVIAAKPGNVYTLPDISMEILGPIRQNNDLNNMSVICKATVQDTAVLIPGDASIDEMSDVYRSGRSLKSDVYIVAHHGSNNSYHKKFLSAVSPELAIISCGKDNSYNHPHKEITDYLKQNEITFLRTDEQGDIVVRCYDETFAVDY